MLFRPRRRCFPRSRLTAELEELRPKVSGYYQDRAYVFRKHNGTTLLLCCSFDHKIETEAGTSPYGPIYSLSEVEQLALREFLNELADHFIGPSHSSAGAPILFIRKKDGSLRLAVDYRELNRITKKDSYPLSLILDLLDRLRSIQRSTYVKPITSCALPRATNGRPLFVQDMALTSFKSCTTG